MSAAVPFAVPAFDPRAMLAGLFARQRLLATVGIAWLLLVIPFLLLQPFETRTIGGVDIWVKPAKFLMSTGVFLLTSAWYFGYVRPDRRGSPLLRGAALTAVLTSGFENAWIIWQAAQGKASHFNLTTPLDALGYALMGLGAVLLVGSVLPLGWAIARHPLAGLRPDYRWAVVIGLVMTVALGGGLGGYMSAQAGHAVGPEGQGLPLFGWNRLGGDLRVAHFLGIHAEQIVPLFALLFARFSEGVRWAALGFGATALAVLTLALFGQAVAGLPLLPG